MSIALKFNLELALGLVAFLYTRTYAMINTTYQTHPTNVAHQLRGQTSVQYLLDWQSQF